MDGEFHRFEGGGIRYTKNGKGRFDLIPHEVIDRIFLKVASKIEEDKNYASLDDALISAYKEEYESSIASLVMIIYILNDFERDCINAKEYYVDSMDDFVKGFSKMLRELAIHYEKGAEKYGVDNWKKGIPEQSFRDSGLRHLCQWISGETDEPHHIAAIWNFFGAIWTRIKNEPIIDKVIYKDPVILNNGEISSTTSDAKQPDHWGYSPRELNVELNNITDSAIIKTDLLNLTSARFKNLYDVIYKYINIDDPLDVEFLKGKFGVMFIKFIVDGGGYIIFLQETNSIISIKYYLQNKRIFTIEIYNDNIKIDTSGRLYNTSEMDPYKRLIHEIISNII